MLDEMLEAALDYAAHGWLVVPLHSVADGVCTCGDPGCTSAGKHPRTRTGLSEASLDHAQIRLWWERWPASNVGIATGERSGIWVLDVDAKGSPSGVESWAALVAEHGQQETQTAETGSGGAHVVYAWADGVRNRQGIRVDGERTQIDVRGDGGYIVAPPSVHASGRRYQWVRQGRPAPAPEWLLDLVLPPVPKAGPPPVVRVDALDRETRYAQAVLRTAVDRIGSAGPGARHQTITREVYSVAGFERLLGEHGLDTLLQAVIATYAAEPKRHRKAAETVRDTWAAGAESPREVPDRRPDRGPSGPSPSDPLPDDGDIEPTDWSLLEAIPGASDGPPPIPVEAYDDEIPDGPARQTESETPVARIGPRMIQINLRPMMDVVGDAWAALAEAPAIDRLYQQDGRVVRIMSTETGARVEECNAGSMVAALLGSATYCKLRKARKGEATDGEFVLEPSDRLPGYLSQAMLGRPDPGLPVLEAIHSAPYVAPGPVLVRTAGYHPAARAYLDWAGDLELPDLGDAQDLLGEWVGDFPFASDSDRAHWFASLLAPMMRGVIRGPVPLTVYEAPAPGTGKSLLMMVTARVASGRTVAPAALSSNEDERRKAMLAHLGAGPPVVCLDNVTGTVNDDVLAGVITAWPRYTDRRMGGQSLMSVPAISSWCMSANNATMSPDIARRMVRVGWTRGRPVLSSGRDSGTPTSQAGPRRRRPTCGRRRWPWCGHGPKLDPRHGMARPWDRLSPGAGTWAESCNMLGSLGFSMDARSLWTPSTQSPGTGGSCSISSPRRGPASRGGLVLCPRLRGRMACWPRPWATAGGTLRRGSWVGRCGPSSGGSTWSGGARAIHRCGQLGRGPGVARGGHGWAAGAVVYRGGVVMRCPLFVELCAGTAALSLRLHAGRHARPPVSRMGAKTGYAHAILRPRAAARARRGGRHPLPVVRAGCWGAAVAPCLHRPRPCDGGGEDHPVVEG
jgi:hypothetical protein